MRHKDAEINLPPADPRSNSRSWESINCALLMDLRDEMKQSNELLLRLCDVLECRNAADIPRILRRIDKRIAGAIDKAVNKP